MKKLTLYHIKFIQAQLTMDMNWDVFTLTQSTMPEEQQQNLRVRVIDGTPTQSPFNPRDIIPQKQLGSPVSSRQDSEDSSSEDCASDFLHIDIVEAAKC